MSAQTDRVSLRRFTPDDYDTLLEWPGGLNHAYLAGPGSGLVGADLAAAARAAGARHLMIVSGGGREIGAVTIEQLTYRGNVRIVLTVGDASRWQEGCAGDAVRAVLAHLFHERDVHRVQAVVASFDRTSVATVARAPFVLEGILLAEAGLQLGRHDELIAELSRLVAENRWRERLHRQLMLAYYRAGRQAEALETFHALRRRLADGLAIEPDVAMRRLYQQILVQDRDLDLPLTPVPHRDASAMAARHAS